MNWKEEKVESREQQRLAMVQVLKYKLQEGNSSGLERKKMNEGDNREDTSAEVRYE